MPPGLEFFSFLQKNTEALESAYFIRSPAKL